MPTSDAVDPDGSDVAAEPVTHVQDTDSGGIITPTTNAIGGSAVQEQAVFEAKLDPDSTEVEQQASGEPIQSSDAVQEMETKEPLRHAASEESQAKDVFTATDEIVPSTEVLREADEDLVNTAETGLEDVPPKLEVTEPAQEAKPGPEVISDEVQGSGEAQTESTDIVGQVDVDAHSAAESIEATPVHDKEAVELEPTRSIEQDMIPIDALEPPMSTRTDVAFEGVQATVSQDVLVQHPVPEDVPSASEVPAKDQSGDIESEAATPTAVFPSTIVGSGESRAAEPTEDRALPATEQDVEAKSSGANAETADAFAPNMSDGEAVSQPVAAPSTEPLADEVQRSSVAKDTSTSELSVVGGDLDANVKASDASALHSSILNPEETVSQFNHELEAPATEDPQSEPPLVANIEAADTPASNLNIPVSEEVASQPVQTDVPVPSAALADEVQPSLTVDDPPVPDQPESIVHVDPAVGENPSANVETEVLSQSVKADTAAPEQSTPAPSTHDEVDLAVSTEPATGPDPIIVGETSLPVEEEVDTQPIIPPASDADPEAMPAAEPEGTTSQELRSSDDSLGDEEITQSQAPVETRQEPAEADIPPANVEPGSESEPEAHATEHEDKVLSPPVGIPTSVEPGVADHETVDVQETDSGALLENVGTTGAAVVDEMHGSFMQPDALTSNVESEPAVEIQQESTSEPGPSNEVPVATDPEPILSEAEDKAVPRNIPGSNDVETEVQPLDSDASKPEVAVEGPDDVAPSNGIAGTNGMVMNGGSFDADTEGDNSENTSANQDQENHTVPLDNGIDSVVFKDVPVEGVRSLDEASKERGLEVEYYFPF